VTVTIMFALGLPIAVAIAIAVAHPRFPARNQLACLTTTIF
jgi:hypothetical protein